MPHIYLIRTKLIIITTIKDQMKVKAKGFEGRTQYDCVSIIYCKFNVFQSQYLFLLFQLQYCCVILYIIHSLVFYLSLNLSYT